MIKLKITKGIFIFIMLLCLVGTITYRFSEDKVNQDQLEKNIVFIEEEKNKVYSEKDTNEEKYLRLLEVEVEPFNRGCYASVLAEIYKSKRNYNKVKIYNKKAIDNYMMVENGMYYAVNQQKSYAWAMYDIGNYTECFLATNQLIDMLNNGGKEILSDKEYREALEQIDVLFLRIYTKFDMMSKAKSYYNKVKDLETTSQVVYGKMEYAEKKKNFKLRKKYAEEYYNIILENDKKRNTEFSEAAILIIAYANLDLEEYEEAYSQILRADKALTKGADEYNKGYVYIAYAKYYMGIGEENKGIEYYDKAIEVFEKYNNYNQIIKVLKDIIVYLESKNNNNGLIIKYYKEYYKIDSINSDAKELRELLQGIVTINEKLNSNTVINLNKEISIIKISTIITLITLLLVVFVLIRMRVLIKKKNDTEKKLEMLVNTDYLTNVSTRSYGERILRERIKVKSKFCLAVIDIDNFKNINDIYGHMFGDYILKEVSKLIKDNLDEEDIIYRFGGEEFIVVFFDKDIQLSLERLNYVRNEINNRKFHKGNEKVSFSAGVIQWDGRSLDIIIKEADELLYKAKKQGKNKIVAD